MRRIQVEFDIQNVETYMTLGTYILDGIKSGTHEERRQYSEGTSRRSMGAMSRIMIQQENERQLDTIRARVME